MGKGATATATRRAKEETVAHMGERLRGSAATVVVDYRGLDVAADSDLRRRLRQAGVEYRVVKNTLLWRAAEETGLAELEPLLSGPTAVAFSPEDPTVAARELAQFARDHQQMQFKGGVLAGRVIGPDDVRALAELPSREVLLARLAGALAGPLVATATVLGAPMRALATATQQLQAAREGAA